MCCWNKQLSFSLYLILFHYLFATRLIAQDCPIKPDATLRDIKTIGQPFVNCTNSSTAGYTLQVENTSLTKTSNTFYTIDWGDGAPVENLGDFSTRKARRSDD